MAVMWSKRSIADVQNSYITRFSADEIQRSLQASMDAPIIKLISFCSTMDWKKQLTSQTKISTMVHELIQPKIFRRADNKNTKYINLILPGRTSIAAIPLLTALQVKNARKTARFHKLLSMVTSEGLEPSTH